VSDPDDVDGTAPGRDATAWDQRYRESDGPTEPHPSVAAVAADLPTGRALDIACGTGRHSLLLAERGWQVTAVDFAEVGAGALRRVAAARGLAVEVHVADARTWSPRTPGYDLVVMAFVHLPDVVPRAAGWLAPGGSLLVVGHSVRSPQGAGPSDPRLRLDRVDLAARVTGARLRVLRAVEVERATPEGTAVDVEVLAVRP
jgi:SAM-dependent methyltransferase